METKKILGATGIAIAGLLVGAMGASMMIEPVTIEKPMEVIKYVNSTQLVPVEVEKIVEKNISVENPLNLQMKEEVQDLNKLVSAYDDLVEDIIDEDADADYVIAVFDGKMDAEKWIESDLIDLLQDEDFFEDGEVLEDYRKSEVSIKDIEEISVSHDDYEDKDFELTYEVRVKAKEDGEDREYFDFEVIMPYENGKLQKDDIEVSLI